MKVNDLRVSVILPVRHGAENVARALDSVFSQTYPAHEILIADDGSVPDLARALVPYRGRVTVVRSTRTGTAVARNEAINRAKGDVLAFLDADDYWEAEKLACQMSCLEHHPEIGLAASLAFEANPGRERLKQAATDPRLLDQPLAASSPQALALVTQIKGSSVVVRRNALGRHRFDPMLKSAEDQDLWVRLLTSTGAYLDSRPLATVGADTAAAAHVDAGMHCSRMLHVVNRYHDVLGSEARRGWEARIYRDWAVRALAGGESRQALEPAWKSLQLEPFSVAGWQTMGRCLKRNLRRPAKKSSPDGGGNKEQAPAASTPKTVARNMIWNWAGIAVPMASGFVVSPFLIHHLGGEIYGLWIVIASLSSYFGMLDLGVRGSVGRYIAFYKAKNDQENVNATISTAMAILFGAAALALLATGIVAVFFLDLFQVPEAEVENARLALLLIGLNLAIMLPLNIFDATLWAFQRFDISNAIDIPTILLRTGLTFWLVGTGSGLVALAWITLLTSVSQGVAKAWASFRLDPALRLRFSLVRLQVARTIYGYGIWSFILYVTRMVPGQMSPLIIGNRLGLNAVTPFNVASRLTGYTNQIMQSSTGVLTPLATTLHARSQEKEQQQLFMLGGKCCLILVLFFVSLFVFLGKPFITLWVGPDLADSWKLLLILIVGELIPMSQGVTNSVILSKNRHRLLACYGVAEVVLALSLAYFLASRYGLYGACFGVAIPGVFCRGLFQMFYGCRVLELPVWTYVRQALLPPLLGTLLPSFGLGVLTVLHRPDSWLQLIAYGLAFAVAYLFFAMLLGLGSLRFAPLASYRQQYLVLPPD
jgi:O-antigen/teichoic acid export membrane protein/glycosyltransferase involved in cell wall biosynthesis